MAFAEIALRLRRRLTVPTSGNGRGLVRNRRAGGTRPGGHTNRRLVIPQLNECRVLWRLVAVGALTWLVWAWTQANTQ